MSSAAELALKKKYALLQKKKQAAEGDGKSGSAGGSNSNATSGALAQDPARLAAIRALQARKAVQEPGTVPAAAASASEASGAASAKPVNKVKLVIPKREAVPAGSAGAASAAPSQAAAGKKSSQVAGGSTTSTPTDPARAAALATLRAKVAPQQQAASAAGGTGTPAGAGAGAQVQQPKRPTLKRPSARPRPTPQQQLQQAAGSGGLAASAALDGTFRAEHACQQQQLMEPGVYYAGTGDEGQPPSAKRQRLEQIGGGDASSGAGEVNLTLFVGDLPQYWATADLYDFFSAEFGAVRDARVIGSQCYGFVTFESSADAEGVLQFAQQQGIWVQDRPLRVNWAQGDMPEWKRGPAVHRSLEPGEGPQALEAYENPRVREARLQAQQLAASVDAAQVQALAMQRPPERHLVSYEDL